MAKEYNIGDVWVHPDTGITGKITARHEVKNHVHAQNEARFVYEATCPDLVDRDGKPSKTGTQRKIKTVVKDIDGKEQAKEILVFNKYSLDEYENFREPAPVLSQKELQDEVVELREKLAVAVAAIEKLQGVQTETEKK